MNITLWDGQHVMKIDQNRYKDIFFIEEPFCEHCGELKPFEPVWEHDGTWWCTYCAKRFDEFQYDSDALSEIDNIFYELYIKWLEDELYNVREELERFYKDKGQE